MKKMNLVYREIYFVNDFDEYIDEDNVDEILEKAVAEIKNRYRRRPRWR